MLVACHEYRGRQFDRWCLARSVSRSGRNVDDGARQAISVEDSAAQNCNHGRNSATVLVASSAVVSHPEPRRTEPARSKMRCAERNGSIREGV